MSSIGCPLLFLDARPNVIKLGSPCYYKNRLWKVSWSMFDLGSGRVRIVKCYERRVAIGAPWEVIRGATLIRAK